MFHVDIKKDPHGEVRVFFDGNSGLTITVSFYEFPVIALPARGAYLPEVSDPGVQ